MNYDVAVVGGGPAGAAAAIHLGRLGHRVLLLEKRRLPAHKLCGEFLSVEVGALFDRLGVGEAVRAAGATSIDRAYVTTADGGAFRAPLPGTALGLSRYTLDRLLFDAARAAGADARDGTSVRGIAGRLEAGFDVETAAETFGARLVLGAYGRRGLLDRKLGRTFLDDAAPFVGFKAHFDGPPLGGTIELHAFRGGYCGLVEVEQGRVNACWITREHVLRTAGGRPEGIVETAFTRNPVLAGRFSAMTRVSDAYEAVSQVSFARKPLFSGDVLMVGDSAAMIAPLCGDGMAMALGTAELAAPLVHAFLRGDLSDGALRARYAAAWEGAFTGRLRVGRWIHHGFIRPAVAGPSVRLLHRVPALAQRLIRATRG